MINSNLNKLYIFYYNKIIIVRTSYMQRVLIEYSNITHLLQLFKNEVNTIPTII